MKTKFHTDMKSIIIIKIRESNARASGMKDTLTFPKIAEASSLDGRVRRSNETCSLAGLSR